MDRRTARVVRALTVVAALYIVARFVGWTGPYSRIDWEPGLMYPAIAVITLWGIARITKG